MHGIEELHVAAGVPVADVPPLRHIYRGVDGLVALCGHRAPEAVDRWPYVGDEPRICADCKDRASGGLLGGFD